MRIITKVKLMLIVVTLSFMVSCCREETVCVVYRLQDSYGYVFEYDGKVRSYYLHNPECASIGEFINRYSSAVDTFFSINNTYLPPHTDSIIFVFDDIEATTCMKFALSIHGKNAESYVHFPEQKEGMYSFSLTESERIILEALIANVIKIHGGVYCSDASCCTSSFQLRLYGDYGTRDYICISDLPEYCDNLFLARDLILTLNNRYCNEENKNSSNYSNPFMEYFNNNAAIKEYYMPPVTPNQ